MSKFGKGSGLVLVLGMVACTQSVTEVPQVEEVAGEGDRPQVVATNGVLCDLTRQIGGEDITLTCLLDPGEDPHVYQPTPSDRQALEAANLVFYGGYQYAPGISSLVQEAPLTGAQVAVFEAAVPQPLMMAPHHHAHGEQQAVHDHDADHDAEQAHDHDAEPDHAASPDHETAGRAEELVPDPHVYHQALNGGAMVQVMAEELAAVDPDRADAYATRAAELTQQFTALDGWIREQVETVPLGDRRLVTTHDAFRYFADAYGFEVAGALSGLSTQEQPTASRLTALVDLVKSAQVPVIFAETTTNPQLIQTVARDAGVTVPDQALFVAGPGEPGSGADSLQGMLASNTCTIVNGLGGKCRLDSAPLP